MDPQALFGPLTTRSQRIGDFDTFILNNVPYAQVPPRNVQWGAVQYDGPQAPGIDRAKPVLQWHFGGVPYPISKAIRLHYTYIRTWDGSGDLVTAAIFLGFQDGLTDLVAPQPIPFVPSPTQTFRTRVTNLGLVGQFSNSVWASDQAVLASEANGLITRALRPSGAGYNAFNDLIQTELGWHADHRTSRFTTLTQDPIPVDFDGPAQDSDSHNVFQYTNATIYNDLDKYGQVLFWYFGGKPFRLTKALRIPLDPIDRQQSPQPTLQPSGKAESFVLHAAETDAKARTLKLQDQAKAEVAANKTAAEAHAANITAATTPGTSTQDKEAAAKLADSTATDAAKATVAQGHSLFIGFAGPGYGGGG